MTCKKTFEKIQTKLCESKKALPEEGYSQKEIENLNTEQKKRFNDLEFLKRQNIPGTFPSPVVVKNS